MTDKLANTVHADVALEQVGRDGKVLPVENPPLVMITPGEVLCNLFYIEQRSPEMVAIVIQTEERFTICEAIGGSRPGCDEIILSLGNTPPDKLATAVVFTGFPGWRVFAAHCGKYGVNVCLIKDKE